MAHNLYKNSMAYAGETPWHKLGVQLPANATWEAIQSVVPFYTAIEREVFVPGIDEPLPDVKALLASDNGRYLATVGIDYGVVQFGDMARSVMQACNGDAVFHTAGLLGPTGVRGWLLGEVKGAVIRVPGDTSEVRPYFLATAAHDGAHAVQLLNCATRVVCNNTLNVALTERGQSGWTIRHTANAAANVVNAGAAFAKLRENYQAFGELAALMGRTAFGAHELRTVLDAVMPEPTADGQNDRAVSNARDKRVAVMALADGSMKGAAGIVGTAWGAFQALSEWADHSSKVRALPSDTGARLNSIMFGAAADLKQVAFASILKTAGIRATATA